MKRNQESYITLFVLFLFFLLVSMWVFNFPFSLQDVFDSPYARNARLVCKEMGYEKID